MATSDEVAERIDQLGVEAKHHITVAKELDKGGLSADAQVAALFAMDRRLEQLVLVMAGLGQTAEINGFDIITRLERMELNTQQTAINTRNR